MLFRSGQDRIGQDRTGQDRTGQDRTGQDRTGQDRTLSICTHNTSDRPARTSRTVITGGSSTGVNNKINRPETVDREIPDEELITVILRATDPVKSSGGLKMADARAALMAERDGPLKCKT